MENLYLIQKMPTSIDGIHESCFRSTSILKKVLEMIKREDSKETIFEVVEMMLKKLLKEETVKAQRNIPVNES